MKRLTRLAGSGMGTFALFPFSCTDASRKTVGEERERAAKPRRATRKERIMAPSVQPAEVPSCDALYIPATCVSQGRNGENTETVLTGKRSRTAHVQRCAQRDVP